ncbi:MAG: DNRLRE domain-containing protein [Planctomycetota bacterium]|jgi:hypothetical protein
MRYSARMLLHVSCVLALGWCVKMADAAIVMIGASRDNTLFEDSNGLLSNGAGDHLFAGKTFQLADRIRRGVIAFDLDGHIPVGAEITNVSLTLYMSRTNSGVQPVSIHRLLSDWGEGTSHAAGQEGAGAESTIGDATWLHSFFDTELWDSAGGDFVPTSSADIPVNAEGFYTWGPTSQMLADVRGWVDDPTSNFGWILVGNEAFSLTAKRFDSKDNVDPTVHPTLTIEFEAAEVPAVSSWGTVVLTLLLLVAGKLRCRSIVCP